MIAAQSQAAVLRITSTVSTTVQELIAGAPGSINADSKQLGVDADEPPIAATANLESTDLEGNLVSTGQGYSRFDDPTRLDQANPEELSLEAACYSRADTVSYRVDGTVNETRTIIFTRPGSDVAPPEIQFRSDGTREIESSVFVEGALVIWSTGSGEIAAGLRGQIQLVVTRNDDSEPLWESQLEVTVDEELNLSSTVTGPLLVEEVSLEELATLGVDEATLAVLADAAEMGLLRILVIPRQEHSYSYVVTADEPVDLTATLATEVRNSPAGTGIAVVLGRPFERLAEVVAMGLPGADGAAVERSINEAVRRRDRTGNNAGPIARFPLCGALGMETFGFLLLGFFPCLACRRGR